MAAHWAVLRRAPVLAAIFVAATLALLIWGVQLRQANRRLEADLRGARHAARPALPRPPRGEEPDALRAENQRLRRELQDATVPQVNVPTVTLAAGTVTTIEPASTVLLLIAPPAPALPEYRLRVLAYDGSIVWEGEGLKPSAPQGVITVVWPGALARPGQYRAELFGPAATDRRVQTYPLTVPAPAAG
jgi:hypothetical protein